MIPESIYAILSCARIGAVHSVVFGGFASAELADRIIDAKPKMIITASAGIEPNKMISYFPIVNDAIKKSEVQNIKILLYQREDVLVTKTEDYEIHQNFRL
jgi:acyl-coenzyme A synthetase/AMP-(fatty) acid ligase